MATDGFDGQQWPDPSGFGAECVESAGLGHVGDVWPRIVVAGDGALSLSGSGSSDSTSIGMCGARKKGEGPKGQLERDGKGGWLEETPSRVGEPNLLTCST